MHVGCYSQDASSSRHQFATSLALLILIIFTSCGLGDAFRRNQVFAQCSNLKFEPPTRSVKSGHSQKPLAFQPDESYRFIRPKIEAAMSNYVYEAVDAGGLRSQGALDVTNQSEALKRIREMGLFPTTVREAMPFLPRRQSLVVRKTFQIPRWMSEGRIKPAVLAMFTRQLATLVDVGMPLLRGLRLLQEQEENRTLRRVITEVAKSIESGGTLSEALAAHPKVFNRLYVNMVKAGETGGILELVLRRQAEFMEKALKIKGKIKTAMFYPAAVLRSEER